MPQTPETDSTSDSQPAAARRRGMPQWLFWLRAAFVLALLPLAFLAAAAVMVVDREITAPSWIEQQVAERVAEALPQAKLEFGTITLRIGRDLHPHVRLVDTRLLDAGGMTLTRIPVIEGLISPRGLILRRQALVQEVQVYGAQVNLRRARDGTVSLALSGSDRDMGRARNLPALLEQFDQVFERPALAALETVTAQGLIVNFDDARVGRSWIVDAGRLSLDLRGAQTALRGDFALLGGRPEVTTVALTYRSPRGSRTADIGLNIDNGVATDLATQSPALSWLGGIDAPISADMRTGLDAEGMLGPLNARLEIGEGVFQPSEGVPPVRFRQAQAYFAFDPVRDLITFSQINVESDWGQLRGEGDAYLRAFDNGLPRAILAQLQLTDVAINPAGLYATAPALPAIAVDLRARFDPFTLEIGQIVARDAASRTIASGRIAATDAGWDIALDANTDRIAPARVADFWPPSMKPGSRRWFINNVEDGTLTDVVFGLRAAPQEPPEFALGFEFAQGEVAFMRTMPSITGAEGVASMENNRFVISLDHGRMLPPEGGPVDLAGSTMTIADLRANPSPAIVDLRAQGSVTSALSILNQEPFRYLDRANLPVTIAEGRAETSGTIRWPLMRRPDRAAVQVAMTSSVTQVRSDSLVPGRRFAAPRLRVTASRDGLTIAGPASVSGIGAVGTWEQRFGDPDNRGGQVVADVTLSQAFLDAFGIALPTGTIAGQGAGQLALRVGDGPPRFTLTSDLQGVRVAIPAVDWVKQPQASGDLLVEGVLGAVPEITRITFEGDGLQAEGQVILNAAGGLDEARFSRLRVGNWLDAPVTLVGRGTGQPVAVRISGGTLDLRDAAFGTGEGGGGPISIALDSLQVTEGIALQAFRGEFRAEAGLQGDFQASLNGQAPVTGAVVPRDGRIAVRVRSADAGAVLRASGLIETVIGGDLDLTLVPSGDAGTFDGTLAMDGVRVRDAPTIAALLDAISVVGLLQQLDGQGLAFEEVDARFRLTPSQVIVAQASAVGPGLGISVDGTYTLADRGIDLQGVVSPFYLVNGLGAFLTRKGEGLIGFNFNIGGTADAPQVAVNPLSALTPGMFREIFRRPAPNISQ